MIEGLTPYAEYKESGQKWLGGVPSHWDLKPGHAAFAKRKESNLGMKEKTVLSLSYGRIKVKAIDKQHGLVPESYETYQVVNGGNIIIRGTDLQNDHTSLRIGLSHHRGIISSAYVHDLDEDQQVDFKGKAKSFTRSYDFLATILPYGVQEWEKLSIFLNFLIAKLPAPKEEDLAKGILNAIDMDSYRAEKKAMIAIALPDADAEIEPAPTGGGGRKPEPELDKLSNIVKQFNDQFGGLFLDSKSVEKRITEVIPPKVAADPAYQNAKKNTPSTARIEHDKALKRVITAMFKDDAQLFKQFQDNDSFRGWLTATVFDLTAGNDGN